MRPILFAEDETNFNHNGIGVLDEALTSEVTEVTNGEFEVIIDYPISGRWFKEIKNMMIVRVKPNAKDDDHNFRIYDIDKTTSTKTITIYAHSITNDLGGNLVKSVKVDNKTAQEALNLLKNSLVEKTDITFQSDITTKSSTEWTMQNPLNAIVGSEGSMVQYWGGEIKRTDRILYLMSRRGTDRVTTIRPQKGMTGLTMKTSTKGIITRILPYFVLRDEEKDTEQTIVGTIVASPLAGNYPIDNLVPVDYGQDDEINTLAKLNEAAKTYFTTQNPGCDKPDVEINVDLLQLADTPFYSKFKNMEAIGLTDTIIVYVPKYDVNVEVKVNELVYNSLAEKTTSITAGDASGTFYESSKKDYDKTISALQQYVTKSQNGLRNYVQISANGKNKVFRGYTEPDISLAIEGDLWFKEIGDGEQEIWIFDGAYWQPLMTAGINAETQAALDLAQQEIDLAKADLASVDAAMKTVEEVMATVEADMAKAELDLAAAKKAADDALIAADDARVVGNAAKEAGDEARELANQAQADIDATMETVGTHTIDLTKLFADVAGIDTTIEGINSDIVDAKEIADSALAKANEVDTTVEQIVIDTTAMNSAISDNAIAITSAQETANQAKAKADAVEGTTKTIIEDIAGVTSTLTAVESGLDGTTKKVNEVKDTVDGHTQTIATVKDTADSALSKASVTEETVDGMKTTLTQTKTTADSALSKANTAQSTADGNTSTISSVKTTANAALSTANTAKSTADGNTSKITSVSTTANSALSKANVLEETVDGVSRTITSVQEILDNQEGATRNHLKDSESPKMDSYLNSNPIYTMDQSVPEWKATNAVRHKVLGGVGDHNTIIGVIRAGGLVEGGRMYVHSIYVSNVGSTRLRITNNLGKTLDIMPGETKRVVFPASSNPAGTSSMQFVFYRDSKDLETEFILWHAMIADGTIVSSWVPSPDDLATVTKVNQVSDTVDGHTQLIASTKTTADSALSKANSAQSTADGNTSTISSVKTTADSALTKANTAQSTADGNTTKITAVTTTANSALSKANTLEETVDGVTRTITGVQSDLANISQGANNLLKNSSMSENTIEWGINSYLNGVFKDGYVLLDKQVVTTSRSSLTYNTTNQLNDYLEVGTEYSLGFAYYVESVSQPGDSNTVFLRTQYGTNAIYDAPIHRLDLSETGVWKWVFANGSTQTGKGPITIASVSLALDTTTIARIRVKEFILVKGKNVKEWSPNISDLATTIKVNTISDTVDGHTQLIASTKTTADSALSKANSAQSTADGNTSKITSVQTTADSALSKANITEQTVDGMNTTLTSVEKNTANWNTYYQVNTATPKEIKELNGSGLDDRYMYEISAQTLSTGTTSKLLVRLKPNQTSGTGGLGWTLEILDQLGTRSNHPRIYLDETTGKPMVTLWGHASLYNVFLTITKSVSTINQSVYIENTVEGVKQTITAVKETADSAVTKANTAQSTADGNTTKITSVTTTANSALSKATSVETTANGLKVTVGEVRTDLNSLDINDRNLYTSTSEELKNISINGYNHYPNGTVYTIPVTEGTVYTARAYISNVVTTGTGVGIKFFWYDSSSTLLRESPTSMPGWILNGESGYFTITDTAPTGAVGLRVSIRNRATTNSTASYKELKVQKGNKATVWTPAPEDLATASQFTQLSDQIDLRVQKNGVINAINVSTEGVVIAGNKITITGTTTIATGVIKTAHIADANISTAKIADLAVANGKIANLAVTEGKIGSLAVTNAKIGDLAVNSGKIADASIITAKIGDLAVSEAKIANLAVTNAKIGNLAVTGAKIANATIVSGNIQDAAIINAKIANLAVTGAKIADATITSAKIVSLDAGKITANSLSAITTNTGALNVTGWLTMATENKGMMGSYDFGDAYEDAYNYRWFVGDWRLSHRHLTFQGKIYNVTSSNTRGSYLYDAETFLGNDYLKFRRYNSSGKLIDRADLNSDSLLMGTGDWGHSATFVLRSNAESDFNKRVNFNAGADISAPDDVGLRTGRIDAPPGYMSLTLNKSRGLNDIAFGELNTYFNETRLSSANFRIGVDGDGRVIQSTTIYDRTYGSSGNVVVQPSGSLGRSTSASKYKLNITEIPDTEDLGYKLLTVSPKYWFDKHGSEMASKDLTEGGIDDIDPITLRPYYGLIAEDLRGAGLDNFISTNHKTGEIEGIEYDRLWVTLIPLVKKLTEENVLKDIRLNKLERLVEGLING